MNAATRIRICILIAVCLFYEAHSDSVIFQEPLNNAPVRPSYGLRESVKRSVIFRDQSSPPVRGDSPAPPRFVRPTASDLRPSRSLIFPDNQGSNGQLTPAAAVLNAHLPTTEQRPQKPLNFIPSPVDEFSVTSQTLENKPVNSPPSKELVSAMELLVEKISTLEKKFQSNTAEQAQPVDVRENSIVPELVDTLEELMERTHSLEQRLQNLEAVAADWKNTKLELATTTTTTTTTTAKPATTATKNLRLCPEQFFIFENATTDAPCYYVSSTTNRRSNWGDAASSCHKLGAKLLEPKTPTELQRMAELLLALTDRIGGNYWTGGINPGLLWMWTSIIRPLDNIPSELWVSPTERDEYATEDDGKCLSLAYDKKLHRYALQGFECQKYLYFICEYDDTTVTSRQLDHIPKSLNSTTIASTTVAPKAAATSPLPTALRTRPSTTTATAKATASTSTATAKATTTTTTTPTTTTSTDSTTTTPRPVSRLPTRITSRIPARITTRLPVRSSTVTSFTLKPLRFTRRTTEASTVTTKTPLADDTITTFKPVQANYIGVIGFKGVGQTAEANLTIF